MSLFLIDDQGEFWPAQSVQLRQTFDSPHSGGEFVDYAVMNLGFISAIQFGKSCQVKLRPSFTSNAALKALGQWLQTARCDRMVVTAFEDDWTHKLVRASGLTSETLCEALRPADARRPGDFLARDVVLGGALAGSPLLRILSHWPATREPSGQRALLAQLKAALGGRYVVFRQAEDNGRIVFHEFGPGLFSDYETWRTCAVGAPMEEQPDRAYGRWVASAYYDVMTMRQPRIEDVDAIVRWPNTGRARLRYKRIVVPLATDDPLAPPMMLGGSLIDNRVDLRVGLV